MLKIPPDWGTFFALIVSFLGFWFIFKRLLFGPFLKLLAERELKLEGLNERTEQLLQEGRAADEERTRQLAALKRELLADRESARRRTEEEARTTIEEARLAAKDSIEEVRLEIEQQLRVAEQHLGELGESLALELAERVLGRSVKGGSQMHSQN